MVNGDIPLFKNKDGDLVGPEVPGQIIHQSPGDYNSGKRISVIEILNPQKQLELANKDYKPCTNAIREDGIPLLQQPGITELGDIVDVCTVSGNKDFKCKFLGTIKLIETLKGSTSQSTNYRLCDYNKN